MALERLAILFGKESTFVELQHNLVQGDTRRIARLAQLACELELPVVATGNVHYHDRDRHRLQDAMVAIHHRATLESSHRLRRPNSEFFLRAPQDLEALFHNLPEAIANVDYLSRALRRLQPGRPPRSRLRLPGLHPPGWRAALERRRRARHPLLAQVRGPLPGRVRPGADRARPPAAPRRAAAGQEAPPGRLLPDLSRPAGAGHSRRPRGARRQHHPRRLRPAARPRPRLLRQLDHLLPDRSVPRRSGPQPALLPPFPQRGSASRPGHRPRLRTRHPRAAHPGRLLVLRPRPRRARVLLRHLPPAQRGTRPGQGARPAAGRDRQVGQALRGRAREQRARRAATSCPS